MKTFHIGSDYWSCFAEDIFGRKIEVWGEIDGRMDLDESWHGPAYIVLQNLGLAHQNNILVEGLSQSDLSAWFDKDQFQKILDSARIKFETHALTD